MNAIKILLILAFAVASLSTVTVSAYPSYPSLDCVDLTPTQGYDERDVDVYVDAYATGYGSLESVTQLARKEVNSKALGEAEKRGSYAYVIATLSKCRLGTPPMPDSTGKGYQVAFEYGLKFISRKKARTMRFSRRWRRAR